MIASGRLTTFAGQSKYQIVVSQMEVAGEGALLKQLEERRRLLAAEGLFDNNRKRKIPVMPSTIGVVTSLTGAVIKDILHRLNARFGLRVLVWSTLVQGESAGSQVAEAIKGFDQLAKEGSIPKPDVLIVARGGGSLEDLWAFNEEKVVRAVSACTIPVISAIGHESDTTLIDFVADLRAPTPTAAAEMAVPVKSELFALIAEKDARLKRTMANRIDNTLQLIRMVGRALGEPSEFIARREEVLDYSVSGLANGLEHWLSARSVRLLNAVENLRPPERQLAEIKSTISELSLRMTKSISGSLELGILSVNNVGRLLEANSFERVLDRGFALITNLEEVPVKRSADIANNENVLVRFADGQRHARFDLEGSSTMETSKKRKSLKPSDQRQEDLF